MKRVYGVLAVILVTIVLVALLTAKDKTEECESCAIDQETLEEYYSPTIITPSDEPEGTVEPSEEDIEEMIRRETKAAGMSEYEVERFVAIAYCESRFDPNAKNKNSSARGLYQILAFWDDVFLVSDAEVYDPVINTHLAIEIYKRSDFNAWSCNALV